MSENPVTVTITRSKEYKSPLRHERYAWKWFYSWTADDGSHMRELPDGRTVNIGSYGTHLASLRDMLRRKYRGRALTIREEWKS